MKKIYCLSIICCLLFVMVILSGCDTVKQESSKTLYKNGVIKEAKHTPARLMFNPMSGKSVILPEVYETTVTWCYGEIKRDDEASYKACLEYVGKAVAIGYYDVLKVTYSDTGTEKDRAWTKRVIVSLDPS
jgi:hypothetical protein